MFRWISGALALLALPCLNPARSQHINGTLADETGAAVADAAVSLLSATDSSWIQSTLSNGKGAFYFDSVAPGSYMADVQALGYQRTIFSFNAAPDMPPLLITVPKTALHLEEVSVTAMRSFIETEPGKTIINVEMSPTTAGSTVLDLLRKSPGVSVSGSGNISMQGKQGVLVLIDDKPTYLSGEELAQYLRSMSAEQVAALELITQPSARYDAEGNAGIINIKTKKNRKQGFNGSAFASYTQGLFPLYSGGARLNHQWDRLRLWGSTEFARGNYFMIQDMERNFRDYHTYEIEGTMLQHMYVWERPSGTDLNAGGDYELSDKTDIGMVIKTNYNPVPYGNNTDARIHDLSTGQVIHNRAVLSAEQLRKRAIGGLYLNHSFREDNKVSFNADYIKYWMQRFPQMRSINRGPGGEPLDSLVLRGRMPIDIDVFGARADHEVSIGKWKVESGVKSTYVRTENEVFYELLENKTWREDTLRNNRFLYRENINAAYASVYRPCGEKWTAKAGLRAEHTFAQGRQSVKDQSFTRNYLSLFPTAYLMYKADSSNTLELNYGRRIQRPEYRSLNPFVFFVSQYNYDVGNPLLQPEFSHNAEIKHSFKNVFFTTLSYRHTDGTRQTIVTVNEDTKVTYAKPENAGTNDNLGVHLACHKEIYPWWQFNAWSYVQYSWYRGVFNGRAVSTSGAGYYIGITNQFSFGETWTASCRVDYGGISRESMIATSGPWFFTEAGVSKKVWEEKLLVKLNVEDPFYLARFRRSARINELDSQWLFRYNTRLLAFNITWFFGSETEERQGQHNRIGEDNRLR